MEANEDDIKKFDTLEGSGDLTDSELQAIRQTDTMMRGAVKPGLSLEFTRRAVSSAIIAKRRKSRNRFIAWVSAIAIGLVVLIVALALPSSSGSPATDLPQLEVPISLISDFFSNEKFRQLFLISEAIILLLIVDQLVGKRSFFRPSSD